VTEPLRHRERSEATQGSATSAGVAPTGLLRSARKAGGTEAITEVLGRLGVLRLTPSNASDVTAAPAVLAEAPGRIRRPSANSGYDANWLRPDRCKRGRKRRLRHDKQRYRERWRIEATFNQLKDFRRIATGYDTLARNCASAVAPAAIVAVWCITSPNPNPSD
jgi:transposase